MRNFLLISTLALLASLTSCSKNLYSGDAKRYAIVDVDQRTTKKYNLKMDFMGTELSGILAVREMESGEIRMVALTPFGLSLFDFGLSGNEWKVYSCIEPLRKKKVLNILERDFRSLFQEGYLTNMKNKGKYHLYKNGGGLAKASIKSYPNYEGDPYKIRIKHFWLRLSIHLDRIKETNASE